MEHKFWKRLWAFVRERLLLDVLLVILLGVIFGVVYVTNIGKAIESLEAEVKSTVEEDVDRLKKDIATLQYRLNATMATQLTATVNTLQDISEQRLPLLTNNITAQNRKVTQLPLPMVRQYFEKLVTDTTAASDAVRLLPVSDAESGLATLIEISSDKLRTLRSVPSETAQLRVRQLVEAGNNKKNEIDAISVTQLQASLDTLQDSIDNLVREVNHIRDEDLAGLRSSISTVESALGSRSDQAEPSEEVGPPQPVPVDTSPAEAMGQ